MDFKSKTINDRGGYVKNIIIRNRNILRINIVNDVNYINDGAPALMLAEFEDMEFTNLNISKAKLNQPIMENNGFPDEQHHFQDISFPVQSKIKLNTQQRQRLKMFCAVTGQNLFTKLPNESRLKTDSVTILYLP